METETERLKEEITKDIEEECYECSSRSTGHTKQGLKCYTCGAVFAE